MKKIISLFVFTIALVWTWKMVHSTSSVGFETHSGIQEKFAELIQNTIKAQKPQATAVEIIKMWTETIDERKVRALFSYRFTEPSDAQTPDTVERKIEGEAILYRDTSNDPTQDKWTLQSLSTKGDQVSYVEGSLVTPDNAGDDEKESAPSH